ncbi:unnamed protein product [Polarella glacialis]|uniref:RING-type domain-containing protein n=1 Tax=Polarella glacialis TaxID=89957 RepID=A0A813IBE6_POLGL|nr:unnamed protein product [Polarella glacialis]CAE8692913.1 unnamed protein product [Polarella glacialis]
MDFLQQLNQVSCEASEQRHAEQELAADALIEEFQKKCLLAAQKGETECRHVSGMFFLKNTGQFSHDWHEKPDFQQEFVTFLHQKLQAMFGQNSRISVSLGWDLVLDLTASWLKPIRTAVQHSRAHAPRSNLISQCPVCLCRAEIVALTPCGHVLCVSCSTNFQRGTTCPVCREPVAGWQNLFS